MKLTKERTAGMDLFMYHFSDYQCKKALILLRPMFDRPTRRNYRGKADKALNLDQQYKGTIEE